MSRFTRALKTGVRKKQQPASFFVRIKIPTMYRNIFFLSVYSLALAACSSGGSGSVVSEKSLKVNVSSIELGATDNREAKFEVTASNVAWSITKPATASWLGVTPVSGGASASVSVSAEENKDVSNARIAELKISSIDMTYSSSHSVMVKQKQAEPYIAPQETSLLLGAGAATKSISIVSNFDWVAETSATWLTATKASERELLISVAENSNARRTASVRLYQNGDKGKVLSEIVVTQGEANVTGTLSSLTFTPHGGTEEIEVSSDVAWSVSDVASWLSVTPAEGGSGRTELKITATPNMSASSRSTYVYVMAGSHKFEIEVKQDGIVMNVSHTGLVFGSMPESKVVTIDSNVDWTADAPDYITLSPPEGRSGVLADVTVSVSDNGSTDKRSGNIYFHPVGSPSFKVSLPVAQYGKTLGVSDEILSYPNIGGTWPLTVITDAEWTASSDATWVQLSRTGPSELTVSAEPNPDADSREAALVISIGTSIKKTIHIKQDGRYMNISCDDVLANSNAGTVSVSLVSNTDWTVSSDAAWLKPSPTEGSGDATITVTASDNPHVSTRTGTLTFQNKYETKTLSFKQPRRTISASVYSIEIAQQGGETGSVIVTTDGKYSVTTADSWIAINEKDNTFTITVPALEGTVKREGSVVLALTDLAGDEEYSIIIPVTQYPRQVRIGIGGFGDDENWD